MNRSTVTLFVNFYLFASYTIANVLLNETKYFEEKKEHYWLCFMVIEDHPKRGKNEDIARTDSAAFRDILCCFI